MGTEETTYTFRCTVCGYVLKTESIPALDEPVEDKVSVGDIDESGKIDSVDYLLIKRSCFGTYTFDEGEKKRADVNFDGEIDSTDYLLVKRICFGTYEIK